MSTVLGTVFNGGYVAAATSHEITLPTGIESGNIICVAYLISEDTRVPAITGYTRKDFAVVVDSSFRLGVLYKVAGGSEPASVTMTFSPAGSTAIVYSTFRTDHDTGDFLNSNAGYLQQDATAVTSPSVAASALSVTSGSSVLALMACEANRSVSAFDADFDQQISTTASTNSLHVYIDNEVTGAGNPQYDWTLNSSRRMGFVLLELKSSAVSPLITAITNPTISTCVADMDNSTTIDTIEFVVGGYTSAQTYDFEDLGGGNNRFTIASVNRPNLPPVGTGVANFKLGASLIVSTALTLAAEDGATAYEVTDVGTLNETNPQSIWYYAVGGLPSVGDWVELKGSGTILPSWFWEGEGEFELRHYDSTTGTFGAWVPFIDGQPVGQLIRPLVVGQVGFSVSFASRVNVTQL